MAQIEFTIRRKVLTLLGAKFHVYNADGNLIGFSKQKAFKLKEDIRIYTDESMSEERLSISARSVIDFSAAYDVIDSQSATKIGALKRKGLSSMFRDEWILLDENDGEVGRIKEDSLAMALMRRVVNIIPQKFSMTDGDGYEIATMKQNFNPFVQRLTVTVFDEFPLNPLMALAAGIVLAAIEGRQKN